MIPVRTNASDFVYRGPTPDVGDAWVEKGNGESYMTWQPTDEEREAIANGALIRMGIFTAPIPPVSLGVDTHTILGAAGAALRDRAMAELKGIGAPGPTRVPAGYWIVGADVWAALQDEGALDPDDGSVPTLYGRPLMQVETGEPDFMEYEVR